MVVRNGAQAIVDGGILVNRGPGIVALGDGTRVKLIDNACSASFLLRAVSLRWSPTMWVWGLPQDRGRSFSWKGTESRHIPPKGNQCHPGRYGRWNLGTRMPN